MQAQQAQPTDISAHVHPELKDILAAMHDMKISKETVPEARKGMDALIASMPKTRTAYDHITISSRHIPGPKDSPEVLIKIYNSTNDGIQRPGLLFIHGGGYIIGNAHQMDGYCQRLAYEADCVVVSVDYRLAPEHPYPAPIEDCYSALVWMRDSAQELGVNVKKIAVMGQSAGGGLCAALTLLARDRGGPEICFQMPLYPMIDDRNVTPSSYEIVDPRLWNRETNSNGWEMYLGDHAKGDVSPYAAPSRATDFSRLPKTYTFIGALDLFRDETITYVTKLLQAKVPVEFHIYPGCFHGFDLLAANSTVSKTADQGVLEALKQAFSA